MQILMISALNIWSMGPGGGAPSLFRTLQAYGLRGHTVHFVTPYVGANVSTSAPHLLFGSRDVDRLRANAPENVRIYPIHVPSLRDLGIPLSSTIDWIDQKVRFSVAFPLVAALEGLKVLRSHRIDLLYGYETLGVLACRPLRMVKPVPFVTRYQGTDMYPALSNPLLLARRAEAVAALKTPSDLVIMTNDGTMGDRTVGRLRGALPPHFRFWRNGIDANRHRPATNQERRVARSELGLRDHEFVVLCISRLAAWKRLDRGILALKALSQSLPSARLVIVGDGEDRDRLERLADSAGTGDRVRFEGAIPQDEVQRYYHAADVFLSAYDLSNVGNPLLEAMCYGKAIVTLNNGTTSELIHDGETGVLLPADADPDQIARAILGLATDPPLVERLSAGARSYAKREFWTWSDRMAAELADVESLLERRQ